MPAILATGQVSIVDLTDNHELSCYLSANMPRTQVTDAEEGTCRPDWREAPHLIITPIIF